MPDKDYSRTFFNQDFPDVRGRRFENVLFSGCKIGRAAGAEFINCTFRETEFTATDLRDLLGMGVTLDCFFFGGVRMTPAVMDALIHLLTLTKGNDSVRGKLLGIIDPVRLRFLQRFFETTERN